MLFQTAFWKLDSKFYKMHIPSAITHKIYYEDQIII